MKEFFNSPRGFNSKRSSKKLPTLENIICVLVFIFFFLIYWRTSCPAVFWWDSGDLIANVAVLGLPHRPGFPIYVLLAKLFSFLPFETFAQRINILSALFASLSLLIFYQVFLKSLKLFFPARDKVKGAVLISALCFLLVFGLTYSFWIQAVRAEVYSLNVLFFSLLLFLIVLHLECRRLKYIYLFFFLLGLGLGNHHISLLSTLPALLAFGPTFDARLTLSLKKITVCVLLLLLGSSVYLYLPVRASSNPPLAWGEIDSISSSGGFIFALETIKDLNLGFLSDIFLKLSQIFKLLSAQLTFLCFTISLIGLFLLFRHNRKAFTFLLLLIAGNCAVVIFMTTEFISTNPDLHGYLIFSIFGLAFAYGMGIFLMLNHIGGSSSFIHNLLLVIFGAISFFPMFKHYSEANLSNNRIAQDYGSSILLDLDSNSVLFADNVNLNFILRELQYAEGKREDISIIDRGLLSSKWYVKQKRRQDRALFSDIPENLVGESIFHALLKRSLTLGQPTYIEFTERDTGLVNHLIPAGYVFKVSRVPVGQLSKEDLLSQKRWEKNNPFRVNLQDESFYLGDGVFQNDPDAQRVFALSFYRLGLFYQLKKMSSSALDKFSLVRKIDPGNQELIQKIKDLEELKTLSKTSRPSLPPSQGKPSG